MFVASILLVTQIFLRRSVIRTRKIIITSTKMIEGGRVLHNHRKLEFVSTESAIIPVDDGKKDNVPA